jgi:MoaA/NifB/PqqE/SkfB family radical SAM enzyme
MNEYISLDNISTMHVEISTLCNAACPMCARNNNGAGLSPGLIERQWSFEDIDRVFTNEHKNLNLILFCGTHGDPLTEKYLFEAVLKAKNLKYNIQIQTNGSLRSVSWWKNLSSILDYTDTIAFGIDGLETNHLYRQNTDIDKILKRVEIVCKSKAKTQWDFIPFKHNEHELELCKQTAIKLGVDQFRIRKTPRFDKNAIFPVIDNFGKIIRQLEPPENLDLRHPELEKMKNIRSIFGLPVDKKIGSVIKISNDLQKKVKKINKHMIDYNIDCVYRNNRRIYVNSDLIVFPCCYISDENESGILNVDQEEIQFPLKKLSLRDKNWSEIINHEFYRDKFVKSFTDKDSTLSRCIKTCGIVKREENQNQLIDIKTL